MNTRLVKIILPPLVPYITVGIGLLVFHNAWLAILGYHALMVAILLLDRVKLSPKQSLRGNTCWIPFVTALAGVSGGLLLYVLWPLLSVPDDISLYIRSIGLNEQTWPVFLAYFIIINPLIEEYYWRGYLASSTRRMAMNDLLFAGYHLLVLAGQMETVWLLVVFCTLVGGAWFWRQMNRINGGLLASVVSHMAADISVMLAVYFLAVR